MENTAKQHKCNAGDEPAAGAAAAHEGNGKTSCPELGQCPWQDRYCKKSGWNTRRKPKETIHAE